MPVGRDARVVAIQRHKYDRRHAYRQMDGPFADASVAVGRIADVFGDAA